MMQTSSSDQRSHPHPAILPHLHWNLRIHANTAKNQTKTSRAMMGRPFVSLWNALLGSRCLGRTWLLLAVRTPQIFVHLVSSCCASLRLRSNAVCLNKCCCMRLQGTSRILQRQRELLLDLGRHLLAALSHIFKSFSLLNELRT